VGVDQSRKNDGIPEGQVNSFGFIMKMPRQNLSYFTIYYPDADLLVG
jgi:hypothetical protein